MLWLADLMTLSRLPLAAAFWLVADTRGWAVGVLAAAALTDLLDGRIARWARRRHAGGVSHREHGAWLDPLCDKLFAAAAVVALALRLQTPLLTLELVAARDLVMVPLVLVYRLSPLRRRHHLELRASSAGKVATAAQFVAFAAIAADLRGAIVLAAIAAAAGIYASAEYLVRAAQLVRRVPSAP